MKYKVIGWTDKDYAYDRAPISLSVTKAVVENVRENGYVFGGDAHENYLPVLNDGTIAEWSWRGWGGIMAKAHQPESSDPYVYSLYYMDSLLKNHVYPVTDTFDDSDMVPRDDIAETHVMHLSDKAFDLIKSGKKQIEVRLADQKRRAIDVFDYVEFRRASCESDKFTVLVTHKYFAYSFESLYNMFEPERAGGSSREELLKNIYGYYTAEDEKKYGVYGIEVSLPSDLKQGHEREVEIWGKKYRLKVYTDRLGDDSDKALYESEKRELERFWEENLFNGDEVIERSKKYFAYAAITDYDENAAPPEFNFSELRMVTKFNSRPVLALCGYCEGCYSDICVTFSEDGFEGVGSNDDYKNLSFLRFRNEHL